MPWSTAKSKWPGSFYKLAHLSHEQYQMSFCSKHQKTRGSHYSKNLRDMVGPSTHQVITEKSSFQRSSAPRMDCSSTGSWRKVPTQIWAARSSSKTASAKPTKTPATRSKKQHARVTSTLCKNFLTPVPRCSTGHRYIAQQESVNQVRAHHYLDLNCATWKLTSEKLK